ncbi:ABC-2 family transporter protein [Planctomycetes bacterium Pla163]|uniref:ABC-2 family transporter protein n=1 Tax=Rohdeia mirabilis TaxID=2528008 RepID=A0A518CZ82_9BACT|nr:ABC-2 family transporter protein [Planctomycetes bacterium Pla163]
MSLSAWIRVARTVAAKELQSAFRDRQTRMYTLLMPLVMYPAMFWVALQASTLVDGLRSARTVEIEVLADPGAKARANALVTAFETDARERAELESLAASGGASAAGEEAAPDGTTAPPPTLDAEFGPTTLYHLGTGTLTERLDADAVRGADALLRVPAEGPVELYFDASRSASLLAKDRVEAARERVVAAERERLLGTSVDALEPFAFVARDVAAPEALGAFILSTMLPLMLIAMATMGAFFPAVDVTAGERERKTFETTLLLPVPRSAVFSGQLASVGVAALAATAMNLVGMTLAANHLLGMLTDSVQFSLPVTTVLLILPVMLAFAIFLSATLTAAAAFTDTFKQGQALLGSVQMIFILPALASTLPGVSLTYGIAAIPIVGTSISLREILRAGDDLSALPLGPLLVSLAVSLLVALAAVRIAVHAMQTERSGVPRWVAKLTGGAARA